MEVFTQENLPQKVIQFFFDLENTFMSLEEEKLDFDVEKGVLRMEGKVKIKKGDIQ